MARMKIMTNEDYGINPFSIPLIINVSRQVIEGDKHQDLERTEYVKVFRTIRSREISNMLSSGGRCLRDYIMYNIGSCEDIINLAPDKYMEVTGIKSAKTLYSAAIELQKLGIICPVVGKKSLYWINPDMFFVGSRPNKYPDNVVIKSTIKKR